MKNIGVNLIKYLLFGFNVLFAISGIGIIIAGALVLSDVSEVQHFMEGKILAPPVVLIVTGCIVFLVASLGCYGAIRENVSMLIAFAICLLVIFIVELAVGIAAAVYKNEFHQGMRDLMRQSLERYGESESDQLAWDKMQQNMQCCGVDRATDWITRPASCCHPPRDNAPPVSQQQCQNAEPNRQDYLYSTGCFEALEMKAMNASKVLLGVGIGIAFVEIIGIVLALWLAKKIRNKDR